MFLLIFYCVLLKYGTRNVKENAKCWNLWNISEFRNIPEHDRTLKAELAVNVLVREYVLQQTYLGWWLA